VLWGVAYAVLVAALVVRVRNPDEPPPAPRRPAPDEPLFLTTAHHRLLLLAILVTAPLEAIVLGGAPGGRLAGLVALLGGVLLYRAAGRALGEALTPFTQPRPGAPLVTQGPYRYLRHPMYLGQMLVAVGAPLLLGARLTLALALADVLLLGYRMLRDEEALARIFPEYSRYAARTKRILPYIY
jgi:protein-S-isoprenylcysteine O-methyltransferase Ste14